MGKKEHKKLMERVENSMSKIAYAEAGELYSERDLERKRKKGKKNLPFCVKGETKTGLCT